MGTRRDQLTEAATDHVLEHGLIGLSLRPLAEALGTSDRMLLYHFQGRDDLVATILRTSTARSVARIAGLRPSTDLRSAVLDLWAEVASGTQQRCQRLYVEAAALGLMGQEPYATAIRAANTAWMGALTDHLVRSGVPKAVARRAAVLVDAAFMGLQIDQPLDSAATQRRTVRELGDAVTALWGAPVETPRPSAPQDLQPGSA